MKNKSKNYEGEIATVLGIQAEAYYAMKNRRREARARFFRKLPGNICAGFLLVVGSVVITGVLYAVCYSLAGGLAAHDLAERVDSLESTNQSFAGRFEAIGEDISDLHFQQLTQHVHAIAAENVDAALYQELVKKVNRLEARVDSVAPKVLGPTNSPYFYFTDGFIATNIIIPTTNWEGHWEPVGTEGTHL